MHPLFLLCYVLFTIRIDGRLEGKNETFHLPSTPSVYTAPSPVTPRTSSIINLAPRAPNTAASDTMKTAAAPSAIPSGSIKMSGAKTGSITKAITNATISTGLVPSSTNAKNAGSGFAAPAQVLLAAGVLIGTVGLLAAL